MSRLLVVEDDPAILRGLSDNLRLESYDVVTAIDGDSGFRMARDGGFDLVILDVMLPKLSGFDVCRRLRESGASVPILMLTARGEETDRVHGLDLGADDYLTKPFSLRELQARVRALLRRRNPTTQLPDEVRFGDVVVDFRRFEAQRSGTPLKLTRKEFGTLRLLVGRAGKVVTRSELLEEVWEYREYPTTRTVDNHVASLRAKIEDDPGNPRHLLTVHGVGYKFVS
ncbi:MAG: response regulator transcription factor [Gemmatimonadaceae bacterium]|nr:response regulator transcription factor [Gemmatimonadaceae bacterium]